MKQGLVTAVLRWLGALTGKRFLYIAPNEYNALGQTAVRSSYGFWYVGNVYDSADIAYGIAQNGTVEKHDAALVDRILTRIKEKHDRIIFYDIGANTGFYGVLAAYNHRASVELFEPVPEYISCIRETIRLNHLAGCTVHEFALGSKELEHSFNLAGSGSSLRPEFIGHDRSPTTSVAVRTLDSLNLKAPHFINIDVEGFEWEVLQGARATIQNAQPVCFIEIAKSFRSRGYHSPDFDDLISFFMTQGYSIYLHRDNELVALDQISIPDGVQMYLFLPPWLTLDDVARKV